MVVCLMEKFEMGFGSNRFIVNMHDFIDGSNPGRMSRCHTDKFFNIISKTYIQLINYEELKDIMKFE
jgi:hypothetical protein